MRVEPSGEAFGVRESASFTVVSHGVFVQASTAARLYGLRMIALDGSPLAQAAPEHAMGSALVNAITVAVGP